MNPDTVRPKTSAVPPSKHADLLASALHLFALEGIKNTPTSKIAQHAGVATGTLFHHFESKELLVNTLYLSIKMDLAAALQWDLVQQPNTRAKIKQFWHNSLNWVMAHPTEHQFLLECSASNSISLESQQKTMLDTLFMLELVEQGKLEGLLKNVPNALLGEIHSALTQAASKYFLQNPHLQTDTQALEAAFQIYWDAIRI